ncbi:MAG TPA: YfhO family protein [Candidatus Dormibacteraeota bacterium]|nr:YfhO family protein [Candidatus Dormibacteraeota bacterium]
MTGADDILSVGLHRDPDYHQAERRALSGGRRAGPLFGGALLLVAAVLFLKAWGSVVTERDVLVPAAFLPDCCQPWTAEYGRPPANPLLADPILQFLPWQKVTADALHHGRLPLWNPYALSGKPLLASDQPAPFSPFNLLALLFTPAVGMSLAMLAKLWVGAVGMAVFLRLLGARSPATAIGGIAYGSSGFIVVWLGWPHASVAALIPWAFAAAEWCLAGGGLRAQAALAAAIGLQFLAGHAESSLHLGFALAVYCSVRWLLGSRDVRALVGLAVGALAGTMVAAIQLLPFLEQLRQTALVADRSASAYGLAHLPAPALLSWLAPNALGNPAYDGAAAGYALNYNESTGFVTVSVLVLALVGAVWGARRRSAPALALVVLTAVALGSVYGPLTGVVGRLPLMSVAILTRMIALGCFTLAALGGLGAQVVWDATRPRSTRPATRLLQTGARIGGPVVGIGCLAGIVVGIYLDSHLGVERAEHLLHPLHGYLTYWLVLAGLALTAATGFVVTGLVGGAGRLAVAALGLVVLSEAWLFAPHYQPLLPVSEVAPRTALTTWLQQNAADVPLAATDPTVMVPDSATLYGLHDVRTYDVIRNARSRLFWSAADPGYHDEFTYTWLVRPRLDWLAAAGVRYLLTLNGHELPGTTPVFRADGVTVAAVAGARPFAWAAPSWRSAGSAGAARSQLVADVSGPPVVEGVAAQTSAAAAVPADVTVLSNQPGSIELRVSSPGRQVVVVEQSWAPGWSAIVDGRAEPVHPANVTFQGFDVPAGSHDVSLRYEPATVTGGLWVSGAGLGVVVLLLVLSALPRLATAPTRIRIPVWRPERQAGLRRQRGR